MKTLRDEVIAGVTLRLVEVGSRFAGVVISKGKVTERIEGDDPDAIWSELKGRMGQSREGYFGFDGARARFLRFFPDGFRSETFAKTERGYKIAAKERLDAAVPIEEAATGSGFGEAVLSTYRATNLLSPFEKTRLQPLLRGGDADAFVRAAARFALGEGKLALGTMERLLRPHENAKWTVVTYLPFLWRPAEHMFLKPTVTVEYAERVGHPFAHEYAPDLTADVYASLLDLTDTTAARLPDLQARDNIDLQSLVWIVGAYTNEDDPSDG